MAQVLKHSILIKTQKGDYMNTTAESIYENICRARNDLEVLPPAYSLPRENDSEQAKVRFADGAMDGIALYHMGVPAQEIGRAHV